MHPSPVKENKGVSQEQG